MNWLAMDVGGSGIKYALANEAYDLSEAGVVPTQYDTHADFIDAVGSIHDRFAGRVSGIAMSSCGELDPDTGHMFSGGTLTFNTGTNMINAVTARCGVPVTVENDANCALLAEAHRGSLTDCCNAAVLVIGTAVGGAIMINRTVYRGSHFYSGNASFTKVDLTNIARRQLDTVNGVRSLTTGYARAVGLPPEDIDGKVFFDRLAAGDPRAGKALTNYCGSLANYIFNLQTILDVEAVAIGGGISAQPAFLAELRAQVAESFAHATARLPRPDIRHCRFFNDSNLVGALLQHHLTFAPERVQAVTSSTGQPAWPVRRTPRTTQIPTT